MVDLSIREKKIICIMGCLNFPGFKESPQKTKELMIRTAMFTAGLKYDEGEMPELTKYIQDTVMEQYKNGLKQLTEHDAAIKQLSEL